MGININVIQVLWMNGTNNMYMHCSWYDILNHDDVVYVLVLEG